MKYNIKRKIQEQGGSYFVTLPMIWVKAHNLTQSDILDIEFDDGYCKITIPEVSVK